MKRSLTILVMLLCALCVVSAHTYTSTSRLASGKFIKIAVNETGVCRISYESLQSMGLNPDSLRIYGYGGAMLTQDFSKTKIDDLPAVPYYMHKGSDNVFGEGDYILFYAQGPIAWEHTGSRFKHTANPYSFQGFYFLSDNVGEPELLTPIALDSATVNASKHQVTTFTDVRLHEKDLVNLIDPEGYSGGGREWYGESFAAKDVLTLSFDFPNLVTSKEMRTYIDVAGHSDVVTSFQVTIGQTTRSFNINKWSGDHIEMAKTAYHDNRYTPTNSNTQTVKLLYNTTNSSAKAHLNYVELAATRQLKMTDGLLIVRNADNLKSSYTSLYMVAGASEATQVWDVTNLADIQSVPTRLVGDTLQFVGENSVVHTYVVIDPTTKQTITSVGSTHVTNQNLHALSAIDMVIISPAHLVSAAQELAAAHERYDGLKTVVVTDQQIFNEFSSGTPDATAYRWLMKMLWDRGAQNGTKPGYLLLFGDGTYDNRKILSNSGQNTLLTYQSKNSVKETSAYATDDYFTWMDNSEGNNDIIATMDISVGRLPVNTIDEAQNAINKIIRYIRDETIGSWKTQLCFLADDGDANLHTKASDRAAESVRKANPAFTVKKIYLDSYQQESSAAGESYPLAKNQLDNMLKNGVLLFDYCGHAGYNNISSEQMLTLREVKEMTNDNLGLWILATCNFATFDSQRRSAAEEAVLNPNGGALAIFASCRTVYAAQNEIINQHVCDSLFAHNGPCGYSNRIGDAMRKGKNKSVRDENNLPYLLLGDPAVRLHYPTHYQVTTTAMPDTLSALSINTLEGAILTGAGDTATNFNGSVEITIYDKLQTLSTFDNDQGEPAKKTIYSFYDYPNILFKGESQVKDGLFTCTFMVPKDIKYNYGAARISYYALDSITHEEGIGYNESFIVGGSSSITIVDTVGPDLRLFINNAAFTDGGKTSQRPHFYANIFDEHGINTVGSGIGHDLLLTIDNDPNQAYVLNDYFKAELGSYQAGQVSYRLPELSEGFHTATFRAWDLLNNSSTASINFTVVKDYAVQIFSVIAYPNPTNDSSTITFAIQHDRPDDVLQARYMLFDMSGRKVWEETGEGTNKVTISTAEAGLRAGMYMYMVQLKTVTAEEYTSKAGKIMVM